MLAAALRRAKSLRFDLLAFEANAGIAVRLLLALLGACLMAVSAQARWYMPGLPVPITGQVFVVLLCGAILGARFGALSQVFYMGIAALGAPWLTVPALGLAVFTGITSGYLFGFLFAAAFIGFVTRRVPSARTFPGILLVMLGGVAIIYLCGAPVVMLVTGCSPAEAIVFGVFPFIAVDLLKALVAAAICRRLFAR